MNDEHLAKLIQESMHLIAEITDRDIMGNGILSGQILENLRDQEMHTEGILQYPSYWEPGRTILQFGKAYDAVGETLRSKALYRKAIDVFELGLQHPKHVDHREIHLDMQIAEHLMAEGLWGEAFPKGSAIEMFARADNTEIQHLTALAGYYGDTIAAYRCMAKPDESENSGRCLKYEVNGLMLLECGAFDEYCNSSELVQKWNKGSESTMRGSHEYLALKSEIEREVLSNLLWILYLRPKR